MKPWVQGTRSRAHGVKDKAQGARSESLVPGSDQANEVCQSVIWSLCIAESESRSGLFGQIYLSDGRDSFGMELTATRWK